MAIDFWGMPIPPTEVETQTKNRKGKKKMRKPNTSKSTRTTGKTDRPEFLKAEHINPRGQTEMEVLSVGYIDTQNKFGLKVNFDVKIGKTKYSFGVKPSNVFAFKKMVNSAIEKKIVYVQVGEYEGKEFVEVVTEDEKVPF